MAEKTLQRCIKVVGQDLTNCSEEGEGQGDADEGVENEQGLTRSSRGSNSAIPCKELLILVKIIIDGCGREILCSGLY